MTYSEGGTRQVWSGKVHRLVALAFTPNPLALPEVNHKDGNKENNCAGNLEWVDRSGNVRHSYASGKRKQHASTLPIVGVKGDTVVSFPSLLAAQKSGMFSMSAISECLLGRATHHKGFTWRKNGEPQRDMHGKITKADSYVPPDLTGLT
jgi:hypothetical protein